MASSPPACSATRYASRPRAGRRLTILAGVAARRHAASPAGRAPSAPAGDPGPELRGGVVPAIGAIVGSMFGDGIEDFAGLGAEQRAGGSSSPAAHGRRGRPRLCARGPAAPTEGSTRVSATPPDHVVVDGISGDDQVNAVAAAPGGQLLHRRPQHSPGRPGSGSPGSTSTGAARPRFRRRHHDHDDRQRRRAAGDRRSEGRQGARGRRRADIGGVNADALVRYLPTVCPIRTSTAVTGW